MILIDSMLRAKHPRSISYVMMETPIDYFREERRGHIIGYIRTAILYKDEPNTGYKIHIVRAITCEFSKDFIL